MCRLNNFKHEQINDNSFVIQTASTNNTKSNESQVVDAYNLTICGQQ